jgi:GNAT superfamily N-acetyltransferase
MTHEPDSLTTLHALEAAAFAAWPALETQDLGPWQLRFAQGYTKRANSANATRAVDGLSAAEMDAVQAFYAARQQPAIFRLASFCTSPGTDDALAASGYRFADLSLVMARPLATLAPAALTTPGLECLPDAAQWLPVFGAVSGAQDSAHRADQATHLAMLQAIPGRCAWGVLRGAAGEPVSCGLAVVHGQCLGLFDIATRADQRGKGLATRLCQGLLAWGRAQGCDTAYLQVMASNLGAVHVYERLAFRRRYHYWYRVGPDSASRSRE